MSAWDDRSVDPADGPSESDLARAKDIIKGEGPLIPEPPNTMVTLFRGYFDGTRFRAEAHVKELSGADEEGIARMMGASAPAQYMNAVLAYGVSQLGNVDLEKHTVAERIGMLDTLLIGEKELLFLHTLRVTYGDQREVTVKCMACEALNEVFFSITDDIPIKPLDEPERTLFDFETHSGQRIEYRLVTGADDAEAARKPNTSGPEANTIILSRVLETVNSRAVVDPVRYVRGLSGGDRRGWMRELTSKQPGPYFEEVKLPCATCGAESLFRPSWADLL